MCKMCIKRNSQPNPQNTDSMKYGQPPDSLNVHLVSAQEAAAICGIALRTWWTWDAAGFVPRPVRIGGSTRWRYDELQHWIAAGCPRRDEWEARK